jgi:fructokinase
MSEELPLIAAIEAGGTKFVCAVGTGPHDLRDVTASPPPRPRRRSPASRAFSSAKSKHGPFAAIGIGSFGPIDLDKESETYGFITTTPKPGWQFTNIVPMLQTATTSPSPGTPM